MNTCSFNGLEMSSGEQGLCVHSNISLSKNSASFGMSAGAALYAVVKCENKNLNSIQNHMSKVQYCSILSKLSWQVMLQKS